MKQTLTALLIALVFVLVSGFTSCDSATCTASGLQPNEQVQVTYRNASGQMVDLVGYADASGSLTISGCQEVLYQFQ